MLNYFNQLSKSQINEIHQIIQPLMLSVIVTIHGLRIDCRVCFSPASIYNAIRIIERNLPIYTCVVCSIDLWSSRNPFSPPPPPYSSRIFFHILPPLRKLSLLCLVRFIWESESEGERERCLSIYRVGCATIWLCRTLF